MIDSTALASEITADPLGLGYAAQIAIGSDTGIAALLNATTGPGAAQVTLPGMSRDAFLSACLPGVIALAGLNGTIQAKWDRLLGVAQAADSITAANIAAVLSMAVTDGVLTSQQAAAIGVRTGSRAEVLFGAGTVVGASDVSMALRGK